MNEASRKIRKVRRHFLKRNSNFFYLLSVSGHFRDYWHNQDKCEAQNDRMKYHNCIQKHPLRVSAEWVHWRNILPSREYFTRPERIMGCISFLCPGQQRRRMVVSLAALLVSWYWQYGDKHCHAANTDHAIMITTTSQFCLFYLISPLFTLLLDPPVLSLLSRHVSWVLEGKP